MKYKNDYKSDFEVSSQPKLADTLKANKKSQEYNLAVTNVRLLEKEKNLAKQEQELQMGKLMMQQEQSKLQQMMAGLQSAIQQPPQQQLPVSPFESGPGMFPQGQAPQGDPMAAMMGGQQDLSGTGMGMPPQGVM